MLAEKGEPPRRGGFLLPRWWKKATVPPEASAQQHSPQSGDRRVSTPIPPVPSAGDGRRAENDSPVTAAVVSNLPPATASKYTTSATPGGVGAPAGTASDWRLGNETRIVGGRLEVRLNPIGGVVLLGGFLLLLLASYQLGKSVSRAAPAVGAGASAPGLDPGLDVTAVRDGQPDRRVLDVHDSGSRGIEAPPVPVRAVTPTPSENVPSLTGPDGPAEPAAAPAERAPGLNYIIVERFHTGLPSVKSVEMARQHAQKAQKWLAEQAGLQTALYPMSNGKGYELWTVRGFKRPEQSAQMDQLADKIRGLGKLYSKEGYLFSCQPILFKKKPG